MVLLIMRMSLPLQLTPVVRSMSPRGCQSYQVDTKWMHPNMCLHWSPSPAASSKIPSLWVRKNSVVIEFRKKLQEICAPGGCTKGKRSTAWANTVGSLCLTHSQCWQWEEVLLNTPGRQCWGVSKLTEKTASESSYCGWVSSLVSLELQPWSGTQCL